MIETERLVLTPLTAEAACIQGQFDVLRDSEVSGRIGVFSQPFTSEQAAGWCKFADAAHQTKTGLLCAVFAKTGGPQIGYAGTAYDAKRDRREWEVGYWFNKKSWGKRYASEALRAVMQQAAADFGVRLFYAEMAVTNRASWRTAQKSGFSFKQFFYKDTPDDPDRPSYLYEKPAAL